MFVRIIGSGSAKQQNRKYYTGSNANKTCATHNLILQDSTSVITVIVIIFTEFSCTWALNYRYDFRVWFARKILQFICQKRTRDRKGIKKKQLRPPLAVWKHIFQRRKTGCIAILYIWAIPSGLNQITKR